MIREYPNFRITVSTYDLPADQDEIAYLDAVEANLKQIAASVTGQAVLFKIRAHGLVMIVPYTEEFARKNVHGDRCNATSSAILPRENKADLVAQVAFSPKVFAAQSPCGRGPGHQADVVLLHELVHAGRRLGLDYKYVPLSGSLADYDNEEEFFAI